MQVTETLNEGLKRKLSLVIPQADLMSRLDAQPRSASERSELRTPMAIPAC